MSISKNLSDMLPKEKNFDILDHLNIDDIDELVKKDIVIFLFPEKCSPDKSEIINELTIHLNNVYYEVKHVFSINELLTMINKNISRVNFIFSFTSLLSSAWNVEKTHSSVYMIFQSLRDFNIHIYPSEKTNYIFESQVYLKMLHDNYPKFSLPQSQFVFYPVWNEIFYDEYGSKILYSLGALADLGHNLGVIQKGFSQNKSIRYVKLEESDEIKKKLIKSMDFVETEGTINNIGKYDENGFKLAIIKPYCKSNIGMIHSVWFIDGIMADFYYCDNKKGFCHYDNMFLNELKKFCNDLFKTFISDICENIPQIVKIDVGISNNKLVRDKYSFVIDDKKMRLYVHNISIDNHDLLCTSKNKDEDEDDINIFINDNKNNICKALLVAMYKTTSSKKLVDIIKKL